MNKILTTAISFVPMFAFAEEKQPQLATYQTVCLTAKDLTSTINDFKEIPFVRGLSNPIGQPDSKLSLVIFANPTTGTFTIAEKADDNLYCILAIGDNFQPVPKELQDEVRQGQEKSTL